MASLAESAFFGLTLFKDGSAIPAAENEVYAKLSARFDAWRAGRSVPTKPIPHKIHQIWLGGPLPDAYRKFCDSWPQFNPDFEYRLWNEESILSLGDFPSLKAFRKAKSFGAKSDIARYEILWRYGGIYADTDFECLRSFRELAEGCGFFVGNLYDQKPDICNAIIAAAPGHEILGRLRSSTTKVITSTEPMEIIEATGPGLLTREILAAVDDLADGDVVFPSAFFYPFPNYRLEKKASEEIKAEYATEVAYAIHYWEVSWSKVDFISYVIRKLRRGMKKLRRLVRSLGEPLGK
jgi:inositol phosphorylceramide mannosyltransferase catalytic subunit